MWAFRLVTAFAALVGTITGLAAIIGWLASSQAADDVAEKTAQIAGAVWLIWIVLALLMMLSALKTFAEWVVFGLPTLIFAAGTCALVATWQATALQWIGITGIGFALLATVEVLRYQQGHHRASLKTCPDCLETIKVGANVCRYCGYRFAPAPKP